MSNNISKAISQEESKILRQRVELDFSPDAYDRLKQIRGLAGAKTNAEVVRNALRVYEWYLNHKLAKHKLQVVADDTVTEVELLL